MGTCADILDETRVCVRDCSLGQMLISRSSAVVIMVGIWLDNSLSETETHSEFRPLSQWPRGSLERRRRNLESWVGVGEQEVITICIELSLTSACTPSPHCPKSSWTQQMLMEAEPGEADSCMLSIHTSRCAEWRREGEKREGVCHSWYLKLHFVPGPGRKVNSLIEFWADRRERGQWNRRRRGLERKAAEAAKDCVESVCDLWTKSCQK